MSADDRGWEQEPPFSLDWARPVGPGVTGERIYHATNGRHHILVVVTEEQLATADRAAQARQADDFEASVQQAVEDAIDYALASRPLVGGALRLRNEDFT